MEAELDDTYLIWQCHIDGYSMPYRLDKNRNGGGVIIYVREDFQKTFIFEWHKRDIYENEFQEK